MHVPEQARRDAEAALERLGQARGRV